VVVTVARCDHPSGSDLPRDRVVGVLGLASGAKRRHDERAGNGDRDFEPVVERDDVQADDRIGLLKVGQRGRRVQEEPGLGLRGQRGDAVREDDEPVALERDEGVAPRKPARDDALDLRLLQHAFAHQDRVWITRRPPGQIPPVLAVPSQEKLFHAAERRPAFGLPAPPDPVTLCLQV
jgi:hypothetical protein